MKLQLYQQLENHKKTVLREGDRMFLDNKHGLAGFNRNGSRLIRAVGGDDKCIVGKNGSSFLTSILSHFGIIAEVVEERNDMTIYKLRQADSLKK